VVRVGTSKGSTISLWPQYIRGISYRGPTEKKKKTFINTTVITPNLRYIVFCNAIFQISLIFLVMELSISAGAY
jgi:hypothetical protein